MRVLQDWKCNSGRPLIQILLLMFRLAQKARSGNFVSKILFAPFLSKVYRLYGLMLLGVDIPVNTKIGAGFQIHHGQALVIHDKAFIGPNCVVRQSVTIGNSNSGGLAPKLMGNNEVGAGAIIIGEIVIGKGATVGAGAVVIRSVPENATVVGNPGRIIPEAGNNDVTI